MPGVREAREASHIGRWHARDSHASRRFARFVTGVACVDGARGFFPRAPLKAQSFFAGRVQNELKRPQRLRRSMRIHQEPAADLSAAYLKT